MPEPGPDPVPEPGADPVPEPVSEPAPGTVPQPEPHSEAVSELASEPVAGPGSEPVPVRPRRGGRTTLLIASAAVLGVLAGGGLGYRIQQQRTPTPLPPLTGSVLAQPKGAGVAPKELPVSQDRAAIYDGDLLKLLSPTPKGAKELGRDWESLADYSDRYEKPAGAFEDFAANDFRRAAVATWSQSRTTVVAIELVQFRDDAAPYTPGWLSGQELDRDDDKELADSVDLPGTMDGKVWASGLPHHESGYVDSYYASGLARVGDIVVEVTCFSAKPVKAATVAALATKQLERL
ncbi:hypothetical protein [Actinacidiphila rubida]|uniref:hypothetical protein n=1 Tax=Actinacidiphila rubida TaxID=310780 RepID=UPI00099F7A5A|nr:hypothetical protein [Actinacidiphila rubida]